MRFGPFTDGHRGFTPTLRHEGQFPLDVPPLIAHESHGLPATPNRSGLPQIVPGPASPAVSPLSGECPNRVDRLHVSTMPSADFCRAVREPHDALSHEFVTHDRPPEVSSTTFGTHPPDLQPGTLMDMDFAVTRPLVRSELPRIRFLFIGSCLRYRFLQTPPRGDALASRLSFSSIRMDGGLTPPSDRTCSAHWHGQARACPWRCSARANEFAHPTRTGFRHHNRYAAATGGLRTTHVATARGPR